jgi:hypothetical protein
MKDLGKIEIVTAILILFLVMWNAKLGAILAVGALLIFGFFRYKNSRADDLEGNVLNPQAIKHRRENLDKIMQLAAMHPRLTNNIVEQNLKVSDATATRYLTYLTNLGNLVRINDRGREVYYQLPQK